MIPRVDDEHEPVSNLFPLKSPKSVALPSVAMVIKSITSVALGVLPPEKIPRLLFDYADTP